MKEIRLKTAQEEQNEEGLMVAMQGTGRSSMVLKHFVVY